MPRWHVNFNTRVEDQQPECVRCVERVHALAAVIGGIPIPPGVQRKIDALNILRAVRGTTGIEGTELTEDEVQQIMETPPSKPVLPPNRRREETETRNAERLMYYIAERLRRNPNLRLTEALIRRVHEITTGGIDYHYNVPGQYRNHAVAAGSYVPPESGEEVRMLMRDFVDWFSKGTPSRWDPIIRALVAHFYVVSIHPFADGNGRVARGVESLLLYQAGVNARGFYSLANFYYRNRSEYVRLLDYVRFQTNGDLTPFVVFALRGLVAELEAVHSQVLAAVRFISFRDYAREVLTLNDRLATKAGDRMFHFLLGLGPEPVSLKTLRSGKHALSYLYRGVTNRTLARDMDLLKQLQLVIVNNDNLEANLDIMTYFTPPTELWRQATSPTTTATKRRQ